MCGKYTSMLLYMMVYCAESMESLQDYVVSKNQKLIYWKDQVWYCKRRWKTDCGAAQANDSHKALATLYDPAHTTWNTKRLREIKSSTGAELQFFSKGTVQVSLLSESEKLKSMKCIYVNTTVICTLQGAKMRHLRAVNCKPELENMLKFLASI